ncbi:helix-turn-helix domain-containing protein [Sphaerisporangium fuscum]|uniref:helix-turn-helix domain-containing protein n=1 Tax=Sphaerisporangium fuscum TaxID=2835868 RepID=UPI001BDCD5B8|nr:helix-turn-helix transcriptional regulator [Sphaerisporangium fuscum]
MPTAHSPSVRGRQLINELKRLREGAQLTQAEVAEHLDWHPTKVFRIETGRTTPHPNDVRALLDLFGVTDQGERDGLLQLTRNARKRGWWYAYRDILPSQYQVYIGLESEATSIRSFELAAVNGLLQTEDYARALMASGPQELDTEEIERRVEVRMTRQKILGKSDRPQLWVILDEAVLRRPVGGPDVLRAQLSCLLEASEQAKTTIQVIPFKVGGHPGMIGPFTLLNFPEPSDLDIVYMETIAGNLYVEESDEVGHYATAFDHLRAEALSVRETRDMLNAVMHELE